MSDKREIFRHGRYEHCVITYWPEEKDEKGHTKTPKYIIAMDANGHELVCHYAMGIWSELNAMDLILRLRSYERELKDYHAITEKKLKIKFCRHENSHGIGLGYALCDDCGALLPDEDPNLQDKV